MTKLIRRLIILNGILIPIVISIILFQFAKSLFKEDTTIREEEEEGIIVDDRLEDAKRDSIALQGIIYDEPRPIYNSTNFYLPISLLTYEEARNLKEMVSSANDFNPAYFGYMNILFLNNEYQVIRKLVDRKASIKNIYMRVKYDEDKTELDFSIKFHCYLIGFEDSNNDGYLNSEDYHDLYISDLDGENLLRVTKGIDVKSYHFQKDNTQIFIKYTDRDSIREEYKRWNFALYDIPSKNLNRLNDLKQKLSELEMELIN